MGIYVLLLDMRLRQKVSYQKIMFSLNFKNRNEDSKVF